jgi:hypothetical protein
LEKQKDFSRTNGDLQYYSDLKHDGTSRRRAVCRGGGNIITTVRVDGLKLKSE